MTLPALVLDDLTWQDMVDAIRTRIAANSRGKWTMHGPQDTGVTLLELFAYLFEQRIYWLDQVHAPLARALLALLDDTPRVTQAARTVLAFPTPDPAVPTRIVAGAMFSTTLGEQVLPLTTLESVDVLPVHDENPDAPGSHPKLSLRVDGHDQTARLTTLGAVPLLRPTAAPGASRSCSGSIARWTPASEMAHALCCSSSRRPMPARPSGRRAARIRTGSRGCPRVDTTRSTHRRRYRGPVGSNPR